MATANSIPDTAQGLITGAMQELGILAAGETPALDDNAWVLKKLQRLIDRYNAREPLIYNVNFGVFTLLTNTQPITIGPGQQFDVNQRPVKLYSCSLMLTGTDPVVEIPIAVRDQQWWRDQRVKNLTSTLPTDVYYSPDWANGNLYFWPIPTQVNDVRLETRTVVSEITAYNQVFTMPPGYWDLIVNELAIDIAPSYERPVSAELRANYQKALKTVQVNNIKSPRNSPGDAGMPGMSARGDFNYYSGMPNNA